MVRRRCRGSKRKYDSDVESESSDEEFEPVQTSTVGPKRYGLRERKQPMFLIEDDDEEEEEKAPSEEEDYDVRLDLKQPPRVRRTWSRSRLKGSTSLSSTSTAPDNNLSLGDGLIDFEDVIRADVVLNQKGTPIVEPRISRSPRSEDGTDRLEVQLDPLDFVRMECEDEMPKNGLVDVDKPVLKQNGSKAIVGPSLVDEIEKYEPPKLDKKEAEVVLSNDYLLGNNFDLTAEEFLVKKAKQPEVEPQEEEVPQINFDSDSDDSVVIIETKHEVIVLDD